MGGHLWTEIARAPRPCGNPLFCLDRERAVETTENLHRFRGFVEPGGAGAVRTVQEYAGRLPVEITTTRLKQRIPREEVRCWESRYLKEEKCVIWQRERPLTKGLPAEPTEGADDAE